MSAVEAQGIIGSLAYSFDGNRLRLVWFRPADWLFTEIERGV